MKVDGDVTKLPKWAQTKIEVLQREVADLQEKIAAGAEGARAFADPYSSAPRPLGKDPHVRFHTQDGKTFDVQLTPKFDMLEVRANDGIVVYPSASNLVTLESRRW